MNMPFSRLKNKNGSLKLLLVSAVIGMSCLSGCDLISFDNKRLELVQSCPPFPNAGGGVAEELETLNPDDFDDLHGWIDRLNKHKEQLQLPEKK